MSQRSYETSHQMGHLANITKYMMLAFFPFLGIGVIALGLYLSYLSIVSASYSLFTVLLNFIVFMGAGAFFLSLGWVFIASGLAQYQFKDTGLLVKYPLRSKKLIPWEEFQQVCICHAAFTTRGQQRATTVICCVKKGEQRNAYGRWKTDNPFHYRNVITIQYTTELYEGIREKCPYEVVDLRNTPAYRIN